MVIIIAPATVAAAGRSRRWSRSRYWSWCGRCRQRLSWGRRSSSELRQRACSPHPCQQWRATVTGRYAASVGVTEVVGVVDKSGSQVIQAGLQRCCALGSIRGQRGYRRTGGGRCSGNRVNSAVNADCWNQCVVRSCERSCGNDKSGRNGIGAGRTPNLHGDRRRRPNRRTHHLSAQ